LNRLKELLENPRVPEPQDDFYELECRWETFAISMETAMAVERQLDQLPPPTWIVFQSLTGARHRIQAAHVTRISESTAAQRSAGRAFERARDLEEKKDRPPSWDD
jgi:hypothetical protein